MANIRRGTRQSGGAYGSRKPRRRRINILRLIICVIIALLAIAAVTVGVLYFLSDRSNPGADNNILPFISKNTPTATVSPTDETPEETPEPQYPAIPEPHAVEGTRPKEDFGLEAKMILNGSEITSYNRSNPINFGETNEYTGADGIVTFRGNNFRDTASYGTVGSSIRGELEIVWQTSLPETIKRVSSDRSWFGSGWTGQPLFMRWPKDQLSKMNILDSKKDEDDLVEVVMGTEGAAIYFLDLKDGKPTRNKIKSKWTLKGAGALDPRSYPLFYVGSGDISSDGPGENMIFSLKDSSLVYEYGGNDSFRDRSWQAFDASTIVHAGTDTITYASETNVVYQFTLNTQYDKETGNISISPSDIFKWKYSTSRSRAAYKGGKSDPANTEAYLGIESSPIFWREYMYAADNGGNLFCINVNTFEVMWISDVLDDTNCSPVFEIDRENGRAYIYIGTSARATRNSSNIAHIPFWKIDAITGEKVWTADGYDCLRGSDSGGIQDTAALGKNSISDLVYVCYANVVNSRGSNGGSWLVAYDKATGKEVWKENFGGQCWSSPVDVYDDNGKGYIVYCSASYTRDGNAVGGFVTLLDGRTGQKLSQVELKGHVEASPAVYEDMIVIGTRGQELYGIKIK